jgi:hypothetical protein
MSALVSNAKHQLKIDHSPGVVLIKRQISTALNEGNLDNAVELASRLTIVSNNLAAELLYFDLALLNQNYDTCKAICVKLRKLYTFEGFVLTLMTRVNRALNNIDTACQSAYYGLMLGSSDLETTLNAAVCGSRGGRSIDVAIHEILFNYVGQNIDVLLAKNNINARERLLVDALCKEFQINGNH